MEVVEKKEIIHEKDQYEHDAYGYPRNYYGWGYKEPASKGTANTGLGFGIAGAALGLLALGGRGLFGLGQNNNCGGPSAFEAWQHSCKAELANQKALYDFALLSTNARFNDRQTINQEMFGLYKSQIDADFGLYKNQRDQFDTLSDRIGKLETMAAVQAAVEPWRSKVTQMEIANVAGMVNLEAERRFCADNKIVNYANLMFYPVSVANVTTGSTTTQRSTFNPLCSCSCPSINITDTSNTPTT